MQDLKGWLLDDGRMFSRIDALLEALVPLLQEQVPVDRVWVGTTVFHPQAAAYGWIWTPEGTRTVEFSHERLARLQDADSPLRRLRRGADALHYTADSPDGADLPEIIALWEQGYTAYFAQPLRFRGEWVGGFTWTTRAPGGFSADHIQVLSSLTPVLSAVVEPIARDRMYTTLLKTYLGADAGQRVAAGRVQRGDGTDLEAAVWFSDVRGFTAMSQALSSNALLGVLDDVFECVVDSVQHEGGQVLKFMGDGVLAVFIADDTRSRVEATAGATRAAQAFRERLHSWNTAREERGLPTADVGIGLHYGPLTYGNIGGPSRLDFTVIGPSVNLAARVEGLCSSVGHAVLATQAFVGQAGGWTSAGGHEVKGYDEPVAIYALASAE